MAKRSPLHVWLYGTRVAELTSTGPGQISCRYTPEALDRWDLNTALLSCALPLRRHVHRDAARYFRGLLPEGAALAALAAQAGVPTYDTFGLLARYGRDVAGAVVIAPEPTAPRPGHVAPYGPGELAGDVAGIEEHPLALHDDSQLSLPGLQNKLLLVATDAGWGRPAEGFPSTHILKVEDRRYPGLAQLEAAALRLARQVGLTTIDVRVETHADVECLIVSRFDRTPTGRLHQEDSCQALDRDAEAARGRGKYQAHGGPSFVDVAGLLDTFAADPTGQLRRLLAVATFTVAIGNADAHGKNLSLLHTAPGVVELAPLYDTVPTALWPKLDTAAAMTVNDVPRLAAVTRADLRAEAARWRLDTDSVETVLTATLAKLAAAAADPDMPDPLAAHVQQRCAELAG